MSFSVEYDKQPKDFLKKAEKHISQRIMDKVDELLIENPVPHNAVAIVGEHGVFRIRVGDYRALYRIDHQEKRVIIFKLEKRSKVYE